MLGLAMREAAECRRCGGPLHETTDSEAAYVPQPPVVCFQCVALAKSEKDFHDHPMRAGLIHRAAKKPKLKPKRRRSK